MQTIIAQINNAETAVRPAAQTKNNAFLKMLARKSDMIGILTVMGSVTIYAASQLMTLAR